MKLNFFKVISMVAAVSVALIFSACGDDSSSTSASSDTESSADIAESSAEVVESSSSEEVAESSVNAKSSSSEDVTESSANAKSSSSEEADSSDWRNYCLDEINKYRATENLKPLVLAPEAKQTCVDEQAAADLASGKAHGHFGDCGEFAQNSGPNFNLTWIKTETQIVDTFLQMMWDEKKLVESGERDPAKKEDYSYIGHYLNMSSKSYTSVACGIAKNSDGTKGWFNVNFH